MSSLGWGETCRRIHITGLFFAALCLHSVLIPATLYGWIKSGQSVLGSTSCDNVLPLYNNNNLYGKHVSHVSCTRNTFPRECWWGKESFEEIKNGKVLVLLATVVSLPSLPVKDTRGTLAACDYYFYIILKYPAYYRVMWEKYHLPLKDSSCKS